MGLPKALLALSLPILAMSPAMACYTVYNPANQVMYSGETPPIDMSYQIHEKLPAVFPTGHLVFGVDNDCPSIDARKTALQVTNVAAVSRASTARSAPRMTRAQREREQDALTK